KLGKAGFIEGRMGRNGGVDLLVDRKGRSRLDGSGAVSGRSLAANCQRRRLCATRRRKGHCCVKGAWCRATSAVRPAGGEIILSDLADEPVSPDGPAVELPVA